MLTEIETKLLTLALDRAATDGEIQNSTTMLIRKLRDRGASISEFTKSEIDYKEFEKPKSKNSHMDFWGYSLPWGKYKGAPLELVPYSYLKWVLRTWNNLSIDLRNAIKVTLGE